MRLSPVRKLTPGDVLAKPVLGSDGRALLQAGVVLTTGYIRGLKRLNLNYVYIQDSDTYDIETEETLSPAVQREVLTNVKLIYDKLSDPLRGEQLVKSGELGREFNHLFKIMFDSLLSDRTFIVNLSAIYSSDAYLYTHCMNVGTMASVLGLAAGWNQDRVRKLGLGSMLHDIGKLKIDKDILDKPGKLTDEERVEVERHCELGYQILVRQPDISPVSAHCALQHHEKMDGTGYPRRLRGQDIHEFGRLLAVADVYDAMTSNRVYRKATLPHEAVGYLSTQAGSHFDPDYVDLFMKHMNIYPNGLPVELSNGLSGVVARANPHDLQRPVVLVLKEQGYAISPIEIDLSKNHDVTIVACDFNDERRPAGA